MQFRVYFIFNIRTSRFAYVSVAHRLAMNYWNCVYKNWIYCCYVYNTSLLITLTLAKLEILSDPH